MSPTPARVTRPLRQELMLLIGLGLLPLLLFCVYGIWSAVDHQARALQRSSQELSRALAAAVQSELDATVESLDALGHSQLLVEGDLPGFYRRLHDETAPRRSWKGIVLTDGQGRVLFKTWEPYGAASAGVIDPESLRRTLATGQPVVGPLLPGLRGGHALAVRVPVFAGTRLAYVLSAVVTPDRFVAILSHQQVPSDWVISVFDSARRRVARSKDQGATVGGPPAPSLAALMAAQPDAGVGVTRAVEGDEVYTGYTRTPRYDWVVAVGAPTRTTMEALDRNVALYGAAVALSALVFGLVGLRVAGRVAADIGRLRSDAVRLGAGDAIELRRSDIAEVDDMAVALHAASQRLAGAAAETQRALADAASANRAKDEFLAVLGHELRNPLAPMLTALHLLDMKCEAGTQRERQIMQRQLDHMRRLVDDLLDVSRIARGTLQIERRPVRLADVVERAVETVQPQLAAQGRHIGVRQPDAPVWVRGDETRLVQALANLLTNGVRFGGDGPLTLDVSTDPTADHPAGVTPHVRIAVHDKGVGLAPEALQHVFEPFYQAPQSLARTSGGLGLGLAIVKTVIELHGGQVRVHSDGPGQGSTFELLLPTVAAPPGAADAPARPRAAEAGRVLVVDDNVDAALTVAQLLRHAGHEVQVAASGGEALTAVAQGFQPDVAVLDIGLPDMDGYQLAQALQAPPARWRGKLVALTGYGQAADKARAQAAGFDRHFTKPAEPAALVDAVDELVRAAHALPA